MIHKEISPDWFNLGGIEDFDSDNVITDDDGKTFFYQKWYDAETARFVDIPQTSRPKGTPRHRFCPACVRLDQQHEVRFGIFLLQTKLLSDL